MEKCGAYPVLPQECFQWELVPRAYGWFFAKILPANALIEAVALSGVCEVKVGAGVALDMKCIKNICLFCLGLICINVIRKLHMSIY